LGFVDEGVADERVCTKTVKRGLSVKSIRG
jgi:hypothetical protein